MSKNIKYRKTGLILTILFVFMFIAPAQTTEAEGFPTPAGTMDRLGDQTPYTSNTNSVQTGTPSHNADGTPASVDFSVPSSYLDNPIEITSNDVIPKAIKVDESGASNAVANKSNTGAATAATAQNAPVQSVSGCVAGQLLSKLLTSAISSAVAKTANLIGIAKGLPVTMDQTRAAQNIEANTNASTGFFIFGVQTGVSWDGIAYCIVNTIIDYIVNSTIQWANSGFKGNPAFIRNPEQFFKQLADREAASFIQELAYSKAGINVCAPFRIVIAAGLASSYSGNYNQRSTCSLSQMQQNAMQSGRYTITTPTDWIALTKPQNNIYYSYINAGDEMNKRINIKNNTATLDLTINRGFLSYKKCKDDTKPESKANPCDTVTPGALIADSLSSTLNIPKERLVSAQKFDQMVDAIVNNLIKIALNNVLEGVTGKSASQARTSDYYSASANYYDGGVGYGTGYGTDYNSQTINNNCNFDQSKFIGTVTSGFSSVDTDGIERPPFNDPDYQSQTSMPGLNANTVNYVVNPRGKWSTEGGLPMGTQVSVKDNTSGRTACAIIGDNGSQTQWGEISLNLARTLGVWQEGMGNSDLDHNITYSFYSR